MPYVLHPELRDPLFEGTICMNHLFRSTLPIVLSLLFAPVLSAETIDFANLPNYATQPRPAYITRNNTPPNNQISNAGATLGRVLFYDKKLSVNNTIACASCHQQAHGFSDLNRSSAGVNGSTGRHSMRLINARFAREARFFWDERAASLEAQTTQPIQDHAEMGWSGANGDPSLADLIDKMEAIPYYPYMFERVYGTPEITEVRMQQALAQFVRSIQSFDSKYDVGRAQVPNDGAPFPNFTAAENAGKQLFLQPPQFNAQGQRIGGGAGCQGCHSAPEFDIDPNSLSNGVIGSIAGAQDLTNRRSPSLRDSFKPNGTTNGAFMHDGSLATMESVIAHYNAIPNAAAAPGVAASVDPRLRPGGNPQRLQLTTTDQANLVAFLKTLSGTNVYTDPKYASPFDAFGNLEVVGLNSGLSGWAMY